MNTMNVVKRNNQKERFNINKILKAVQKAYESQGIHEVDSKVEQELKGITRLLKDKEPLSVESIQTCVEEILVKYAPYAVTKAYIIYREKHNELRQYTDNKLAFINRYKSSGNTADATVDDNSNVNGKNIGILNSEIHKEDNIQISRRMIMSKLRELYPNFDAKQYVKDLNHHIIYKHDESSFAGAIAPYCVSMTMYPFLLNGIKNIGGLSASPKNLDSFCGMYINLIFATSAMFAGAVATSEFLLYFDFYARREWGEDYYLNCDDAITNINSLRTKTIKNQIHQYWQQILYSINQPAAARGLQSAFVNFSFFDKPFFEGMFGDFYFPDGTKPNWSSLEWLQREFMQWFNQERLKCLLTFPVESIALVYKDHHFIDENTMKFVAQEYARGHSFFTYISDTVDSLSSCCRLRNMVTTKEFNFTNGNMGVQTGSKSVITLNLNRIIQDCNIVYDVKQHKGWQDNSHFIIKYLKEILDRVYKYHIAYNELLWDMYDADLLPVYKAGFIDLNKQYLTIGLNGLNQAAEFLGIECRDNEEYKKFCQLIFSTIKDSNNVANGEFNKHKLTFNTELVPAESLAIKNYNWDKTDGYKVPKDTNLYASYIFKPNDVNTSILEKIRLHGKNYIGDYLDGGAACHLNLDNHLSAEQYEKILKFAAEEGCQYLTFNIPNSECNDCGFITKQPIEECPKCHGTHINLWDRPIGYLSKVKNWSSGRQKERKERIYEKIEKDAEIH